MITAIIFAILFCVIYTFTMGNNIFSRIGWGCAGFFCGLFIGVFVSLALPAKMEIKTTEYQLVPIECDSTDFVIEKTDNSISDGYYICSCIINGDTLIKHLPIEETKIEYVDNNDAIKVKKELETQVKGSFVNNFASDMDKTTYILYLPKKYSEKMLDFEL